MTCKGARSKKEPLDILGTGCTIEVVVQDPVVRVIERELHASRTRTHNEELRLELTPWRSGRRVRGSREYQAARRTPAPIRHMPPRRLPAVVVAVDHAEQRVVDALHDADAPTAFRRASPPHVLYLRRRRKGTVARQRQGDVATGDR